MKFAAVVFLVLMSFNTSFACPNVSGEYLFLNHPWNGSLLVTQDKCASIQIRFVGGNTTRDYIATLKTDGKPYEKAWDSKGNSNSSVPANLNSTHFDQAEYSGDRIVWRTFDGKRSSCEGKYSFVSFECKMFEHSLGYDANQKTHTWTQIGWWRAGDGRYGNDVYVLKKVK